MAPSKGRVESDQKKLARKIRDKLRYEKKKGDPVKSTQMKLIFQEQYRKKKEKGQVKSVKDMTEREKRKKRKQWRTNNRASRQKKKAMFAETSKLVNDETANRNELPSTSSTPSNVPHQVLSGRKRRATKHAQLIRRLENRGKRVHNLETENKELKRKIDSLRKRCERNQNLLKTTTNSPRSTVKKMMQTKQNGTPIGKVVRKQLLFGKALERQLSDNFESLTSRATKQWFAKFVVGNGKWLRKYGLISSCNFIPAKILANSMRNRHCKDGKALAVKTISEKVRKDVESFLEEDENSRVCPGKKDCKTQRGLKKQKRMLTADLKVLHAQFLGSIQYSISYSSFCALRPFWILPPNVAKRETCLCQKHENFNLCLRGLYNAKVIGSPDPEKIKREMCCNPLSEECLFRKCKTCRSKNILFGTFDGSASVKYQQWQTTKVSYLDPRSKSQKTTNRVMKSTVSKPLLDLVRVVDEDSVNFLHHEGKIMHQHAAIKQLKKSLGHDDVLIHCDFSENYATKYGGEIQSVHFGGNRQNLSLHTVVVYHKTDLEGLTVSNFCTISENLDHGPAAIWAHFKPIFDFIIACHPNITAIHFLSDGPSSQYRNKTMFHLIQTRLAEVFPDTLQMATWNFHEAGHGKGAPDGIGATVKRTADRAVAQGRDVTDIASMVSEITSKIQKVQILVVPSSAITDLCRSIPLGLKPFKGTMNTHQVVWMRGKKFLHMNRLSCFTCPYKCSNHRIGSHISLEQKKPAVEKRRKPKMRPTRKYAEKKRNPPPKKKPHSKGEPHVVQMSPISPLQPPKEFENLMETDHPENTRNEMLVGEGDLEDAHQNLLAVERPIDLMMDFNITPPDVNENVLIDVKLTTGLCYQCGGAISHRRTGRLCDVCQNISYHEDCISTTQSLVFAHDQFFCCKQCCELE